MINENRIIIFDTETTGFNAGTGENADRLVEVGCLEMIDRQLTGKQFWFYINPEREIPQEVIKVHGITNDFVKDKPKFRDIADDFYNFIKDSTLLAHNLSFDIKFLIAEFERANLQEAVKFVKAKHHIDTLLIAREKFKGQKNSLDALCRRFGIDNSNRQLHGALLDSELLADVYLALTGGQDTFEFNLNTQTQQENNNLQTTTKITHSWQPIFFKASSEAEMKHQETIERFKLNAF